MKQYWLSALSELDCVLAGAERVLIATDFEGALCPIADSPSNVRVAPGMLLRQITTSRRVFLAEISGPALDDIANRLHLKAAFGGRHGLDVRGRGSLNFEHAGARGLRPELAAARGEVACVCPGREFTCYA